MKISIVFSNLGENLLLFFQVFFIILCFLFLFCMHYRSFNKTWFDVFSNFYIEKCHTTISYLTLILAGVKGIRISGVFTKKLPKIHHVNCWKALCKLFLSILLPWVICFKTSLFNCIIYLNFSARVDLKCSQVKVWKWNSLSCVRLFPTPWTM